MADQGGGLAMTATCILRDDGTLERTAMFLGPVGVDGPRNTLLASVVIVTDLDGNVLAERIEMSDSGTCRSAKPLDRERLLRAGRQVLSPLPFTGLPDPGQ